MSIPNLLTVRQFSQKHPAFPEGGLRHRIFHVEANGLNQSGALIRNGRRDLIPPAFADRLNLTMGATSAVGTTRALFSRSKESAVVDESIFTAV